MRAETQRKVQRYVLAAGNACPAHKVLACKIRVDAALK